MNPYFPSTQPATVTFMDVIHGLAHSLGMSPEEEGLQRNVANQMAASITTAYKVCWQFHDWPSACPSMPIATTASEVGRFIPIKGAVWIGELLGASDAKGAIKFHPTPGGFFLDTNEEEITIKFRPPTPKFSAVPWMPDRGYRVGNVVWDDAESGHCFECIAVPPVGTAVTSVQHWVPVPLLDQLTEATKAGAKALYLQTEGQYNSALIVEGAVLGLLEHEIQLLRNQQDQSRTYQT